MSILTYAGERKHGSRGRVRLQVAFGISRLVSFLSLDTVWFIQGASWSRAAGSGGTAASDPYLAKFDVVNPATFKR